MVRLSNQTLAGALVAPAFAFAGAVTGSPTVSAFVAVPGVTDAGDGLAGDGVRNVNFGQFFKVDTATGDVVLNADLGTYARTLGVFTIEAAKADAPLVFNRATGTYQAPSATVTWDSFARVDGTFNTNLATGASVRVSVTFAVAANVDPYIAYGLSIQNNTNSVNSYSFSFTEPLLPPIAGPYSIYADIAGSVVNIGAGTTLALNPTSGTTLQKVILDDGYGTLTNAGVDVGSSFSYSGIGSTGYLGAGFANASGSGSFESWTIQTSFSLTGKDIATLSGYAEITPIPEPGTYGMLLAGMAVVGFMARRRING